jgi:hypothetical protein
MSAALAAPGFSARIQAFAAVLKDAVALTFTTVGRVVKTAVNRSVPVRSTTTSTQFASPGVAVRYPTFRRKLAELEIDIAAVGMTEQRVIFATSTGKAVGAAAASIRKPKRAETMQRVTALAMEALGVYAAPDQARLAQHRVQHRPHLARLCDDPHRLLPEHTRLDDLRPIQRSAAQHHGEGGHRSFGRARRLATGAASAPIYKAYAAALGFRAQ